MVYELIQVLDDKKHQTISNSTRNLGKTKPSKLIANGRNRPISIILPTLQVHRFNNPSRHFLTLFPSNRCFINPQILRIQHRNLLRHMFHILLSWSNFMTIHCHHPLQPFRRPPTIDRNWCCLDSLRLDHRFL
ncbi:hypothetical protein HanIR_Chr10g0486121 [Helianthus annuus]|nr:hypothetical protein HanIR_Chr10g0486121 [Helianthus annuus]